MEIHINFAIPVVYIQCWLAAAAGSLITLALVKAGPRPDDEFDQDILTREQFDVNLRLCRTSPCYRSIVESCCNYIRECATTTRNGYKKPHSFSGANAGIPFRIIALADGTVMINPFVSDRSDTRRQSESNCGSLTLDKPIKIWRYSSVDVTYFDIDGKKYQIKGYLPTVQHEIDHCDGILITDRTDRGFDTER